MERVEQSLQQLLGQFMAAEPEATPLLRRLFFLHAVRDWTTDVPAGTMELAGDAMTAMHQALEGGAYPEALAHLRVWASLLGVDVGYTAPA